MIVCVLALILIVLFIFYYTTKKVLLSDIFNYIHLRKIPGPPTSNVIIGNVCELYTSQENIFTKLRQWAKTYYPIYSIRALYVIAPCILDPADFELVLSNSKQIDKSEVYNILHGWLGTGLLTSNGSKWHNRRKILTPAFHFSILQKFLDTFYEETENFVKNIKKMSDQPYITIDTQISQFTLKTIAETAMGTKLKFTTKKELTYKQSIIDVGEIFLYRLLHSWFVFDFINIFSPKYFTEKRIIRNLHNFTLDVITERENSLKEINLTTVNHEVYRNKKRLAMLDLLLTAKNVEKSIDLNGICEEVNTFMFEGHDTTARALSFALMLIACNKNVQDLIIAEMLRVLRNLKKKPSYEELQGMKYLDQTIKEVLRMYPSVHFISRKLGEELTTNSGFKIPKNTITHLHIYDLHHNSDIYPDPEKFDPDRFLPENCKTRHPFAYIPFSAGPRNCIGQKFAMLELKVAICGILANFVLEPLDTPSSIVLVVDLVLRTKDDIKVKFVPRC